MKLRPGVVAAVAIGVVAASAGAWCSIDRRRGPNRASEVAIVTASVQRGLNEIVLFDASLTLQDCDVAIDAGRASVPVLPSRGRVSVTAASFGITAEQFARIDTGEIRMTCLDRSTTPPRFVRVDLR
jgi:hypothetical protein